MANKYAHLREKARKLRQQGHTLNDIMEMLSIPRSTVYGWIRDIEVEMARTDRQTAAQQAGTRAVKEKHAALREQAYQQGSAEASARLADPIFRDFVNMYLAEGYKRDRNSIAIGNSDPAVMVLSQHWILKLANSDNTVQYRVQIHVDHDEEEIKRYWAELLHIAPSEISIQRKSNSGQMRGRNFRSEHGVLTIRIGDTYLRARMQAWMDVLRQQWLDALR